VAGEDDLMTFDIGDMVSIRRLRSSSPFAEERIRLEA
jgi:hypothetical protein